MSMPIVLSLPWGLVSPRSVHPRAVLVLAGRGEAASSTISLCGQVVHGVVL